MRKIIFLLPLLLSGCYLANGAPPATDFWVKNGKKISTEEYSICSNKVYPNLGGRYKYLYEKREQLGFSEFYKNKEEWDEYYSYLVMATRLIAKCLYEELGYRFKPPLYWCLAQDGADNTRVCLDNMKYRN